MCKKASTSDANPTCTACIAGYYDSGNGNPATCVACTGTNCATCSKDDLTKCSTYKPGYFKQGDSPGTCTPCDDAASGIEGCATCTFSGSLACISCKPNYKASGTNSNSVTCTRACEDDSACGGTAGSCDAIMVGGDGSVKHYCSHCGKAGEAPIDGICNNNKQQNTCENGVCKSCTTGYFLYMGGCYSVSKEPGSLMCTAATNGICTTPTSQYFLVPGATDKQQSVLACGNPVGTTVGDSAYVGVEGCKTCTAPSEASNGAMAAAKCTACDEGKALTGSGYGCVTCDIAGCSACRADNMCEACGDGHRLEGETCVSTGGGNLGTGAIAGISMTTVVICPALLIECLSL